MNKLQQNSGSCASESFFLVYQIQLVTSLSTVSDKRSDNFF